MEPTNERRERLEIDTLIQDHKAALQVRAGQALHAEQHVHRAGAFAMEPSDTVLFTAELGHYIVDISYDAKAPEEMTVIGWERRSAASA